MLSEKINFSLSLSSKSSVFFMLQVMDMSLWFRRMLGFLLLITTVGLATCQSLVKAEVGFAVSLTDKSALF